MRPSSFTFQFHERHTRLRVAPADGIHTYNFRDDCFQDEKNAGILPEAPGLDSVPFAVGPVKVHLRLAILAEDGAETDDLVVFLQFAPYRDRRHLFPLRADHEPASLHAAGNNKRGAPDVLSSGNLGRTDEQAVVVREARHNDSPRFTNLIFHLVVILLNSSGNPPVGVLFF